MKTITLAALLSPYLLPASIANLTVGDLRLDGRLIQAGDVFICLGGEAFIASAIKAGARAVFCALQTSQSDEAQLEEVLVVEYKSDGQIPIIYVPALVQNIQRLAEKRYCINDKAPPIIGITGTNGKSTLVAIIAQLLSLAHPTLKPATIGTLGIGIYGQPLICNGMTTPDIFTNYQAMAQFYDANVDVVTMEVSSHGLDQKRVAGLPIKTAIFTNLSQDHLDYHQTLEAYAFAKKQLFDMPSVHTCIVNADDAMATFMVKDKGHSALLFYGFNPPAKFPDARFVQAKNIVASSTGTTFEVCSPWGQAFINSPFFGEFNVSNCLAALCAAVVEGADFQRVAQSISALTPVAGRMQLLPVIPQLPPSEQIQVVVDFAHTPDALEQTLKALKVHTLGRLWVVFGCGGNRDKQKRALMGAIAETLADEMVVTSDNPRDEALEHIMSDISAGCKNVPQIINDRKQAIFYALSQAKPGDTVLIAGKGHENFQLIGDTKIPFNDVAIATEIQKSLAVKNPSHNQYASFKYAETPSVNNGGEL